jgi:hypothetical protein
MKQTRQDLKAQGLHINIKIDGSPLPWQFSSKLKPGEVRLQYFPPPGSISFDGKTEILIDFIVRLTGNSNELYNKIILEDCFYHLADVPACELTDQEQAILILKFATLFHNQYYLFDNLATGMDIEFTRDFVIFVNNLTQNNSTVIYLTSNPMVLTNNSKGKIYKLDHWKDIVYSTVDSKQMLYQ